jgi:lactate permease
MTHPSAGLWFLAVAPIALLLVLVLWGRFSITVNGLVVVVVAATIAAKIFDAQPVTLLVASAKGTSTGLWVLAVIWPALFLFRAASEMGLLHFGGLLGGLLSRPVENVLVLAWIVPSFIQGVAGFGVPVAVAAPLLMQMGVGPIRAVAMPLVGSHWSVGFGSMGSSFYMGSLVTQLDAHETLAYAITASTISATNLLLSGILVCLMHGGWKSLRQGLRFIILVGTGMAVAQGIAVRAEPSIGALSAGAIGLVIVALLAASRRHSCRMGAFLLRRRHPHFGPRESNAHSAPRDAPPGSQSIDPLGRDQTRAAWLVALPYFLLTISVLTAFLNPRTRPWIKSHWLLGFDFPSTHTGAGHVNPAVENYSAIPILGHPGSYILLATGLSLVIWKLAGRWPKKRLGPTLSLWWKQARRSSPPVVLLAVVATLMTDSGMISTVASGVADVTGSHYPLMAAVVGMIGAFTTGSSTSSQALFAPMQYEIADRIGFPATNALALQLTGSNVGNMISPMSALVGATAIDREDLTSKVVRMTVLPAMILALVLVGAAAMLMAL